MPAWIHERAKHISAKNPSMSESQAWAIATQQSHALGKSPKGYGTLEGRRDAKKKYDTPKDDVKTDNPGELESKKVSMKMASEGFFQGVRDSAVPFAFGGGRLRRAISGEPEYARYLLGTAVGDIAPKVGVGAGIGALGYRALQKTDKSSSMKTAGIAIHYDLEGRPKSAETSDEWLAAHFKDTGTFMVPDRLKDARVDWLQSKCAEVRREAFLDEISKMATRELMGKEALDPRITHALAGAGIGAAMALQGKFGAAEITPEQAEESLTRYERLRSQKPTLGQVGRYAGLGAVSAPAIGVLKNYITNGTAGDILAKEKNILRLGAVQAHGRALAGMAVAGALGSGAIPLVRAQLDQHAEKQKLRQFMDQYHTQQMQVPDGDGGELKTSSAGVGASMTASEYSTPIEGPKRARQTSYIPPGRKLAGVGVGASTTTSEFSGPLSYGGFPQVSAQYSSPVNSLQGRAFNDPTGGRVDSGPVLVPTVKTSGVPLTPRAQFAASSTVGKTPGVLGRRNPSTSMVAKPNGFGIPSPGAVKP